MTTYPNRVADNILPFSKAGTLSEALSEWYFTEKVEDHEVAEEDCELCNQEQLRYHFEIRNRFTNRHLWVGSSCILKFQVSVYDNNGVLLDKKSTAKKLDALRNKMRFDFCIKALRRLAESEENDILLNALNFYIKNKYLRNMRSSRAARLNILKSPMAVSNLGGLSLF
jgi:sugar diacid utilization regulator